jgi:molybdopterin-containing oxidoreductase family membrane subunit
MLATGLIVAYGYLMEAFVSWYSGNEFEQFMAINRAVGPYAAFYWALLLCNIVVPQALWSARVRSNVVALFVIAIIVNIGMWLERFVIVITSLHRDFLTSSWGMYLPTFWDWATFIGTIGLFLALLFLFIRFLPMISISEMSGMLAETEVKEEK